MLAQAISSTSPTTTRITSRGRLYAFAEAGQTGRRADHHHRLGQVCLHRLAWTRRRLRRLANAGLQRPHNRRRLFERLALLQAHHHAQPPRRSPVQTRLAGAANERFDAERHRDIERLTDRQPEESRRRDADDRHGHAFERQRPSDHVSRAGEVLLPEGMADHHDRACRPAAAKVVRGLEQSAERGLDAEHVEARGAGPDTFRVLRLAAAREVELGVEPAPREDAVEPIGVTLDLLPDRIRPRSLARRRRRDELREPIGLRNRQRA